MSKRSVRDGERIETPAARTLRRQRTLLAYYREDPDYKKIVNGLAAAVTSVQLARQHGGSSSQSAGPNPWADYNKRLRKAVVERLRLTDAEKTPLDWAIWPLHDDVVRQVKPELRPGPTPLDRDPIIGSLTYARQPMFEIGVAATAIRLGGSFLEGPEDSDDPEAPSWGAVGEMWFDVLIGDTGFGDKAWEDLRKMAYEFVDIAIDKLKEKLLAQIDAGASSNVVRPSSVEKDAKTLRALYRFLMHREKCDERRGKLHGPASGANRSAMAKSLGIHLPLERKGTRYLRCSDRLDEVEDD